MSRAEQLQWEGRRGPVAASAAFLSAIFLIGGTIYLQASLDESPDGADELLTLIDRQPADFVISGVLQGIGLLLLVPVLGYLYRATRHRRPELHKVALVLAVLGPAVAAVLAVVRQAELVSVAGDFAAGEAPAGGDAEERAENLIDESAFPVIGGIGFAANLALGFAIVLVSLNAMRAGLTSRFLGIVGIIVGVLYVVPVVGGPQIVQLFWLGALGFLFLGRWPGGRGPAWETGEAVPWPSAAEVQKRREEERRQAAEGGAAGAVDGGAPEAAPGPAPEKPEAADEAARERRRASRKRRKRARRG